MSIALLQLLTAVAWFIVALVAAPGTYRLFFRQPRAGDQSKSAFFFAAIIFVGGSSRWLLAPNDVTTWKLVYGLSVLLAIYICVIVWNFRRDQ